MSMKSRSTLPPMRVVFKKRFKKDATVQGQIDYCLRTTNIGEVNEQILRSICNSENLSEKQLRALHEISVHCCQINDPYCTVLRTLKFEEEVVVNDQNSVG